jgi:UDP:flavonoid glycosyltransferase YjiC (YdhE family)
MQVLKEPSFREQAAALGENIRKSQGTSEAVEWILTHIEEKRQADFP